MPKRSAVLLMGPTGSGKSDLAVRLAEQLPLEIISVDSALVYRGMDIGTAKPALSTRERIPHHLIDIRDPTAGYSVGEFLIDVQQAMLGIWSRGRQPLLVGGTMMYFKALVDGIDEMPAADPAVLLLDEPLSALDDETRAEMHDLLCEVRSRTHVGRISRIAQSGCREEHRLFQSSPLQIWSV